MMRAARQVAATAAVSSAIVFGLYGAYTVAAAPPNEVTVDSRDYPVCAVEDCSDQPGQIGVWIDADTGRHWLSLGEFSIPVRPDAP